MVLLLVQNKNMQIPFIGTGFLMPVAVMTRANADTEPKY
jgi:hypothetical protein